MLKRTTAPDGRVDLISSRGSFGLRVLAPGFVIAKFQGHCDASLGDGSIEELTHLFDSTDRLVMFTDAESMTGYDSAVRVRYTQFAKQNQHRIGAGDILLRSKIIAMAVSVVALATGRPSRVHSNRSDFERAIAAAIAERGRSATSAVP